MTQYEGVMDKADEAVVFYSKHALQLKRMPELQNDQISSGFHKENIHVFNNRLDLEKWMNKNDYRNSVVLLMSSGNYEGTDVGAFAKRITSAAN
jgi:UDP-N-acetylmuramate: L-alanyl-gamma-D-glutamyl-meso-diaminopimelate ligase